MKKNFETLRKCSLFENIGDEDLTAMLSCLNAKRSNYQKGDIILAEGGPARNIGIVLSGTVQIIRVDCFGNRSILTTIESSKIFGESFACAGIQELPVDVVAMEDTSILLIDAKRMTQPCCNACSFHGKLIFNLLNIVARKNLVFHQKIEITSKRNTREKLMTYLLMQAKDNGSNTFTIPYNRQELADYLEVERSGLSVEISKLRKAGVLDCVRSTFTLK